MVSICRRVLMSTGNNTREYPRLAVGVCCVGRVADGCRFRTRSGVRTLRSDQRALKRGGPVRCSDVKAQIALLEESGLITGKGGRLVMTEIVVRAEHAILDPARQGRVARGQVGTCGSRQFRHKYLGTGRCRTAAEQGAFARWTFERDGAVSGFRRGRRIALRLPCTKGTRCYQSWTPK